MRRLSWLGPGELGNNAARDIFHSKKSRDRLH